MNTKLPARLVSVLRGFFAKVVSLGERGWQVPEGHFTELHQVKWSCSRGHLQGNPDTFTQSSLLHWPLCGTFCTLGEYAFHILSFCLRALDFKILLHSFQLSFHELHIAQANQASSQQKQNTTKADALRHTVPLHFSWFAMPWGMGLQSSVTKIPWNQQSNYGVLTILQWWLHCSLTRRQPNTTYFFPIH